VAYRLRRPLSVKALAGLLLTLAAISIPSAVVLLTDPSGQAMQAQSILPRLKEVLPFIRDFTPVGIFLLVVYGLLSIVLAYGVLFQKRWAWFLSLLLGVTEVVWILAEITIFYSFGFFIFYPIIGGLGAATVVLCVIPTTRAFYYKRYRRTWRAEPEQLKSLPSK